MRWERSRKRRRKRRRRAGARGRHLMRKKNRRERMERRRLAKGERKTQSRDYTVAPRNEQVGREIGGKLQKKQTEKNRKRKFFLHTVERSRRLAN
jgi:hypothetical protein